MQELLELALREPEAAHREAKELLETCTEPADRSYAYQCLGIVLRDAGRTAEAIGALQEALRAARESGDADRDRDVRATYGATLAYAGRSTAGLAQLDKALAGAEGELAAKIRMRKAGVLALLGRYSEAVPIMRTALDEVTGAGNEAWEARTRIWLGHLELNLGNVRVAEDEVTRAERILEKLGATLERLAAIENLAEIAVAKGDLVTALACCSDATEGYQAAGRPMRLEDLVAYSGAFLAAGLSKDAAEFISANGRRSELVELKRPEFDMMVARTSLAAGDPTTALTTAELAVESFREQRRPWFERRARLIRLQALHALGQGVDLHADTSNLAAELHSERADEAPIALVLAGRACSGAAKVSAWRQAASYQSSPNGLVRASAYLAGALEREDRRDRGGVLRACAAGLDAIDEHRRLMGSSELRALATTHGRELTEIALRHAAHDPRTLLRWSERTRATALAQPPATSDAATIPASLAALRDNGRRLAEARKAGDPTEELEKERLRLERAVRTESHTQSADTDPQRPASAEEIVAGVGEGCLVELVDVDGCLNVLVVHNGRVRRKVAGTTKDVAELLGPTAMLLRRASRGRAANTTDLGRRLEEAILGDAARLIPDGPVVLAPTARLHGLAWSLLPTLHNRPFSVVPSAGQWLRAGEVRRPRRHRTLLVAGPHLESGGAEVPLLAERHPDATLLDGPAATVTAVLDQLDGAGLAHLATHGRFRADSPLFSSLDLADGPLTVHDLERLPRAPYRVVLSACESGVLAPVGAQELLGLAAALFSIGTAGLVSSVGEVNDAATADLMVGLHDALATGADPATALLSVRQSAAGDPVAAGTAAAFVALGV